MCGFYVTEWLTERVRDFFHEHAGQAVLGINRLSCATYVHATLMADVHIMGGVSSCCPQAHGLPRMAAGSAVGCCSVRRPGAPLCCSHRKVAHTS